MTTFSVRLDSEAEAKLRALLGEHGSRNSAIKHAIDVAYQRQLLLTVQHESRELLEDEQDRAELVAARAAMGSGDAW